jgi:uncharacterized protein YrzB (UPF0473 family)
MLDEESVITIVDDQGNEKECEIFFTFESEEGVKYVLYYDPNEDEPEVYSSIYDDEGHLYPVESKEEWDMIEEVFQTFVAEEDDEG